MNLSMKRRCAAMIAGACIAGFAARALSQDFPSTAIDHISLNPTSFYVSILVSNTLSDTFFALEAYEGEPVGATGGVQRTIVSDWVKGTDSSLILYDTSAPLSASGRTYNVAISMGGTDYILGPNEVYAPYPFFTLPVISSIAVKPTDTGQDLAITYGEGLYTNTIHVSSADATGFIRIKGTNHVPTNAVVERSLNPAAWPSE